MTKKYIILFNIKGRTGHLQENIYSAKNTAGCGLYFR